MGAEFLWLGAGALLCGGSFWFLHQFRQRQSRITDHLAEVERLSAALLLNAEAAASRLAERERAVAAQLDEATARMGEMRTLLQEIQTELQRLAAERDKALAEPQRTPSPLSHGLTRIGQEGERKVLPLYPVPEDPDSERRRRRAEKWDAVWKLAVQGYSVADIAAETGVPRGEVEVMLALGRTEQK